MSVSSERIPLSKKKRFDIFRRDAFTCRYCGKTPPAVMLVVDHIISVRDGGNNASGNLATSCVECNQGKGAQSLSQKEMTQDERLTIMQEQMEEVTSAKLAVDVLNANQHLRTSLESYVEQVLGLHRLLPATISSLVNLTREFSIEKVVEWIDCAANSVNYQSENNVIRYIHGCAKKTRQDNEKPVD